jgi:pyruvate/2-oxoglutarate dehydrogenase complex dihydrolipoamide dehydrogenase (E3) component
MESFDLIIIGAGSGGLTGASFAAKLGAKVALVEKNRIGGDCTWTGCVPSKALLKAAHVAHDVRRAHRFGIDVAAPQIDMKRVREYVRGAIDSVHRHEEPEALKKRGIRVVLGAAAFTDAHTIRVGEETLTAKRFVICTGARAATPRIDGLADVRFETYETIFDNERLPRHLLIAGAGPIGVELAQAYRRLGADVTVVGPCVLPREEPEVRAVAETVLAREGIHCVRGKALAARRAGDGIVLATTADEIEGDMLLVAAGRRPNVADLGLERAGVEASERGIVVDDHLRTSARHVYAAGDVVGGHQFTHFAGWQCFQAVRNALLPGSASGHTAVVPWVTFVDPEIARVGATEAEARTRHGEATRVHRWQMSDADRAVCDDETTGFIKLVAHGDGKILGASVVASRAGEMIGELALAMSAGLTLTDLSATIHAYPTWSTAIQQLAAEAAVDRFVAGAAGKLLVGVARRLRG